MKLLTPFIVLGVGIAVYFFYVSPQMTEVKSLIIEKDRRQEILDRSKELAQKRDSILADFSSIDEADIKKLDKIIPESFNPLTFVNDLSVLASGYGIGIKDYKVSNVPSQARDAAVTSENNSQYKTTIATVSFTGQYAQFVKFISTMETSLQLIDVNSLTVNSANATPSQSGASPKPTDNQLQYVLQMNLYSKK